MVQIRRNQSRLPQTKFNRLRWECGIVFISGESFLLRRGDDLTVNNDRRRRVMIESRNTEDAGQSVGRVECQNLDYTYCTTRC